jgi:hypothetical protein
MDLYNSNGCVLASNVMVSAGKSWFSEQLEARNSGISYEIKVTGYGTGSFTPRAGNARRHSRASEIVATPTTAGLIGGERLPAIPGVASTDLPDVTTAPFETSINLGNVNSNFVELQLKCLTGCLYLTVIAAAQRA